MVSQSNPSNELYNLRWNSYFTNLINVFTEHQNQESLVDVTLGCEGQFIKAHRLVLSACSGYFQKIFQIHTSPQPLLILLNDVKFDNLRLVVQFMYKGEVKVADSDMQQFLQLGKMLHIKGLCSVELQEKSQNNGETRITSKEPEVPPEKSVNKVPPEKSLNKVPPEKTTNVVAKPENKKAPVKSSQSEQENVEEIPSAQKREDVATAKKREEVPSAKKREDVATAKKREEAPTAKKREEVPTAKKREEVPTAKKREEVPTAKKREDVSTAKRRKLSSPASPDPKKKNSSPAEKEVSRIPRPPNAFMIFANQWRKKLAVEYPNESNKDISVRLGNMWKSLSPEMKDAFYDDARKADEQHKIKYPGYYYSPKEARHRKIIASISRAAHYLESSRDDESDSNEAEFIEIKCEADEHSTPKNNGSN